MSEKQGNNGKREDCGGEEKIRCGKEEKIRRAEEEKIRRGILFDPAKPELKAIKRRTHNLNLDYNRTYEDETEKRAQILHEMLGALGEGSFLQGPITFHYGKHTKIGKCFYGNFNLTVQDDAEVVIGDHCDFGPNTTIVTPVHPMVASERIAMLTADGERRRLCYAKPVHIGNGCWFGAVSCSPKREAVPRRFVLPCSLPADAGNDREMGSVKRFLGKRHKAAEKSKTACRFSLTGAWNAV